MTYAPKVIYQDDYILALNKPPGMDVEALRDWISKNFHFPISNDYSLRSGIAHRLDKPTSGVILVAKEKNVFYKLQEEFAERNVNKTYVALVHGRVDLSKQGYGEVNAPVGRLPWKRTRFGVHEGGRTAVTRYKVLGYYEIEGEDFTLLEIYPKTGRTHQIRVHLKYIGHPIVSDSLYAGRKTLRKDLKLFPRLWLHAKSIEFVHPVTGERMKLEASLPQEIKLN